MRKLWMRSALIVAALLAATAGYWSGSRVKAGVVASPGINLGMAGLAGFQTARLNVVNMSDTTPTPGPCDVELKFLDNQGNILAQSPTSSLGAGQATFLDLPRASINSSLSRVQVRGHTVVSVPEHCVPTLEVFDNLTGRSMLLEGLGKRCVPTDTGAVECHDLSAETF